MTLTNNAKGKKHEGYRFGGNPAGSLYERPETRRRLVPAPEEWTDVYLGLGANIGDRAENIAKALKKLAELPTIQIVQVSGLYETAPVGITEQPDFFNAAAHIQTTLSPHALLAHILHIERDMGRVRTVRWGPRPIDIDILSFGNVTIETPELTVPHPRWMERAFVLLPLAEVAPELRLPGQKKTVQELLQTLPKMGTIRA